MFEKSSITQAVNSIYKTLQNRIIKNYNIDDVNESYLIADKLLTIHGLDKEHFNIISVIEKLIEGKINNNSIDDNSNKGEKTIKGILKEASNPIDKIIGYRYLYRKISDIYGKKEAKYLSSLMYDYTIALSDSTNILVPYSYYKHTPIFVRINGKEMYLSFEKLFNMFSKDKESFSDREQINCDKIKLKYNLLPAFINKQKPNINFSEPINGIERDVLIEVWDNNDWIKITHITKHKKDTNMILYQIASGNYAFVTENHPVFMEDGTEKYAKDLKLGDNVLVENNIPYIKEEINVDPKLAYFFGFLYGDGNSEGYKIDEQFYPNESNYIKFTAGGNRISLYQNDIDNSHIYKICKELFPDANFFKTSDKSNRQINFQSHWINRIMTEYFGNDYKDNSFTKSLPVNFMSWKQESKEAFLAGLIDSDGSIFKSDGKVSLRMMSYGIINGLYDAFKNILPIINIRIDEHSGYDGFIFEVSFKITETILNYSDKYQQLDNSIIEKALTYQEQFSNKNYNDNSISKIFIIKDEEIKSHFLKENLEYVFDITTESGSFYANGMKQHNCWSFDSSKLVTIGKPFGQLPSSPVKRFDSYVSLANEVIHQMSNHLAGAISVGTFFLDIGHLLLLNENKTIEDLKNEQYRKYIKNQYQRFIHGVNSLSRSGGAECVTQDTEVLTPQGFKSYMDLKVGDDIYTWKDGKLNIQPVLRVNISEYSGNMIEFKGRDINQTVTQNHKVLYKKFNTDSYKLKDASELQKIKTPIDIPIAFNGIINDVDYSISDELLKLITIILCDGVLKKQEGKLTRIQILKSFDRYGQQEIENLLKTLKYEYSESIKISTFKNCNIPLFLKEKEYKVKVYNLSSQSSKEICELLNETKKNIPDWFFKLSQRQAKIVLETWSKYDGYGDLNKKSEKIKLQCDNYDIANAIQHIAVLAGYGSRITSRKIGNNKQETIYAFIYKRKNKSATKKNIIPYKGIVWCPTTEDGIVVYRKEGRIFISGNSPFSNISLLDSVKLKKMISEEYNWYFMLEDGTLPYEVDYIVNFIIELQNIYMEFFDKGDPLNDGMPYRFPISTLNISKKKNKDDKWVIEDKNFLKRVCKKDIYRYNMFVSEGNKFASCCRLLSDIEMIELASQANSFGAGGSISIGSHRVVTLNIMRLALIAESVEHFYSLVGDMITNIKKILFAHKQLIKDSSELQHFIKIGWINLNRMFSTVGLIGYVEATETLMKKFGVQKEFIYEMFHEINSFVNSNNENFKGCTFNIEQIPAESMAHRLARADKILFGEENVPYNIYANQIIPLWKKATIKERLEADGKCNKALTGGGIVHINTGEHITPLQAEMLVDLAVENNCEHFAITGTFCKCDDNHVIIGNKNNCAKCGKPIKQKIARTVGFFVDVDDMSSYKKEFDHDLRIEFTNGDFDIKGT